MSHDHEIATSPTDIIPGQPRTQGVFFGWLALGLGIFVVVVTAFVLISASVGGFH